MKPLLSNETIYIFRNNIRFLKFLRGRLKVFNTRLGKELHFYSRVLFTEED